ncbi:hypothetical protein ACFQ51_55240 [Streptomyces kaempferi]
MADRADSPRERRRAQRGLVVRRRRGHEQQQGLRVCGQQGRRLTEVFFQLPVHRQRLGQRRDSGQLFRTQAHCEFEERERVAPGAGDKPLGDRLVQVPGHTGTQQRPGLDVREPLQPECGQSAEDIEVAAAVPSGEQEPQAVRVQTPAHER